MMTEKEMILATSRIAQEFCRVLPEEAVLFFAEGLRRRHNSIPPATTRYLDALADLIQQADLDSPPRPKFTVIKGGAA
jgi:hypothetical protein